MRKVGRKPTENSLFLSHATADNEFVKAIVNLFVTGVGVPYGSVFCSSLPGMNIPPGMDFKQKIGDSLKNNDPLWCQAARWNDRSL